MFIFLYTVFRNSSISDEHVFCVALHFTIGQKTEVRFIRTFFVVLFESIKQMDNDVFKVLVLCVSGDKI